MKSKNEIAKEAKEIFGTTTDYNEAGYITINGDVLDFSEKRDGGTPGQRSQDHREVQCLYDDLSQMEAFISFLNDGNIRLSKNNVELVKMPNEMQMNKLRQLAVYYGGNINLDCFHNGNDSQPFYSKEFDRIHSAAFIKEIRNVPFKQEVSMLEEIRLKGTTSEKDVGAKPLDKEIELV